MRQRVIEPSEPVHVEGAGILVWACRIDGDEPQGPEIGGVLNRLSVAPGHAEVPVQRATVVVVPGQHAERTAQRREKLTHQLVLRIGGVVRKVPGDQHGVGLGAQGFDRLDRRDEPGHWIAFCPVRPDMKIAQLDEEKRPGHGGTLWFLEGELAGLER